MYKIYIILCFVVLLFCCEMGVAGCCSASGSGDEAAGCVVVDVDGQVRDILDRVEERGDSLESFQGEMIYKREQLLVDTMVVRNGDICYQVQDETVRFRIHFNDIQQVDLLEDEYEAPVIEFDEDFTFDGRWAVRRDSRTKTLQRWELSETPADRESFRLGEGPFPVPFAITADDVLEHFEVSLLPEDPCDPVNTAHLQLVPRAESSFAEKYVNLDLWIHNPSAVPHQIRYEDSESEITTVTWSGIELDEVVADERFELSEVGAGWTTEVHPLERGDGE